ncbi:MAG TPA: metal-sulfur cluster assembly factor [Gaiellaceae bacterium]|nr:metal-sulfur cluster assembly factor [Gaiellaceae bacterium]
MNGGPEPDARADAVREALRGVIDPELGIDIVSLGLVYGVEVIGSQAFVRYTLTSMGCPVGPMIASEISQLASEVEGIDAVHAEVTFDPPWTPDRMDEDGRLALGFF